MKTYKFLEDGKSCHGGDYTWSLPVKNVDGSWTPGDWTEPVQGALELCENGYHLCRAQDLVYWLGPELYEAEYDGEAVEDNRPPDTKIAVRRCRLTRRVETWTDRTARLFAVWCARQALALIEHPDPRSVAAVDVAERYADGMATAADLATARAAAWHAAWHAARHAAWAAAWHAAWHAARDAAWDAARAAAWAAARAAAWAAARDAAWDAARAAAWAAARAAQTQHLLEMLGEPAAQPGQTVRSLPAQ
jgi:hypothetical protein